MPEIQIHEEVAYNIAQKYKYLDTLDYYLGNLTPDAVNYKGFAEKDKRWTAHLRDKNLNTWRKKAIDFYNIEKDNYPKSFILGYLTHIITDIVFDDYFYIPIRSKMLDDKITLDKTHLLMRNEMTIYGNNSKKWLEIKNKLKDIKNFYSIRNIDKDMLKQWVQMQESNIITKDKTNYINSKVINDLSNEVLEELKDIIK